MTKAKVAKSSQSSKSSKSSKSINTTETSLDLTPLNSKSFPLDKSSRSKNTNSKKAFYNYSFGGSQTFALRQLWPYKAYHFALVNQLVGKKALFKGQEAIIALGVGQNMVESMQYWARGINVIDRQNQITPFALALFGYQNALASVQSNINAKGTETAETAKTAGTAEALSHLISASSNDAEKPSLTPLTKDTLQSSVPKLILDAFMQNPDFAQNSSKQADTFVLIDSLESKNKALNTLPLTQNNEAQSFSKLEALFTPQGLDPFIENISTVWLFHYFLARDFSHCTVLWYLFNRFNQPNFTKDEFLVDFQEFLVREHELGHLKQLPSEKTIKRDLDTVLKCYAPLTRDVGILRKEVKKLDNAEELSDNLLRELYLINSSTSLNSFNRGSHATLNTKVFAYCVLDFFMRTQDRLVTMDFNKLAYEEGSVGRIFKLDEISLSNYLLELAEVTQNRLVYTEQNGIRQLVCRANSTYERLSLQIELLSQIYA